jgi:hypothetical protein
VYADVLLRKFQTMTQHADLHDNNGYGKLGDILTSMIDDLLMMEISWVHSVWEAFLGKASKQVHMHETSR